MALSGTRIPAAAIPVKCHRDSVFLNFVFLDFLISVLRPDSVQSLSTGPLMGEAACSAMLSRAAGPPGPPPQPLTCLTGWGAPAGTG